MLISKKVKEVTVDFGTPQQFSRIDLQTKILLISMM